MHPTDPVLEAISDGSSPHKNGASGKSGMSRRTLLKSLAMSSLPASLLIGSRSHAQAAFPSGPVKLILPQPPGGAADRLMRIIGAQLEERWKQSVIVQSRPGGGSVVGTLATARAEPDGYTIGLVGGGLTINAALGRELPYDGMKDLEPLLRLGFYTVGLVAARDFPANDIGGVIELAREKQGKEAVLYGSNGAYSAAHVAGELLNKMAGIQMQHVPYNGAATMYTNMQGGTLGLGFSVVGSAIPFVESGEIKVLGLTNGQRSDIYPQWPTIAETVPGYEVLSWAGFAVPAGTPADRKARLAEDLLEALQVPEAKESMIAMGFELNPQPAEPFAAFLQEEIQRYRTLTDQIGASLS